MYIKRAVHIGLLILAMQAVSAYKTRCWFLCTDQTAVQNDYVSDRDRCRTYSQLRIDTDTSNPELLEASARKSKLVALFSSCMADKGWTVPDGKSSQQASAPVPVPGAITPGGAKPANSLVAAQPQAAPSSAPMPIANSAAPAAPPAQSAAALAAAQRNRAFLQRSSECAFARHSAAQSSVAAARAEACDIECAERLKAAPDAPRPAACPADPNTVNTSNGVSVPKRFKNNTL